MDAARDVSSPPHQDPIDQPPKGEIRISTRFTDPYTGKVVSTQRTLTGSYSSITVLNGKLTYERE